MCIRIKKEKALSLYYTLSRQPPPNSGKVLQLKNHNIKVYLCNCVLLFCLGKGGKKVGRLVRCLSCLCVATF